MIRAACHGSCLSSAYAVTAAPVSAIWSDPTPKTSRRMAASRAGCSSRPITKSSRTTPISVKRRRSSTLCVRAGPGECGPMITPATSRPITEPRPKRFERATVTEVTSSRKTAATTKLSGSMPIPSYATARRERRMLRRML